MKQITLALHKWNIYQILFLATFVDVLSLSFNFPFRAFIYLGVCLGFLCGFSHLFVNREIKSPPEKWLFLFILLGFFYSLIGFERSGDTKVFELTLRFLCWAMLAFYIHYLCTKGLDYNKVLNLIVIFMLCNTLFALYEYFFAPFMLRDFFLKYSSHPFVTSGKIIENFNRNITMEGKFIYRSYSLNLGFISLAHVGIVVNAILFSMFLTKGYYRFLFLFLCSFAGQSCSISLGGLYSLMIGIGLAMVLRFKIKKKVFLGLMGVLLGGSILLLFAHFTLRENFPLLERSMAHILEGKQSVHHFPTLNAFFQKTGYSFIFGNGIDITQTYENGYFNLLHWLGLPGFTVFFLFIFYFLKETGKDIFLRKNDVYAYSIFIIIVASLFDDFAHVFWVYSSATIYIGPLMGIYFFKRKKMGTLPRWNPKLTEFQS